MQVGSANGTVVYKHTNLNTVNQRKRTAQLELQWQSEQGEAVGLYAFETLMYLEQRLRVRWTHIFTDYCTRCAQYPGKVTGQWGEHDRRQKVWLTPLHAKDARLRCTFKTQEKGRSHAQCNECFFCFLPRVSTRHNSNFDTFTQSNCNYLNHIKCLM